MKNINYLKRYMEKKFLEGYEGYEIVIALLALVKEQAIAESDLLAILLHVYRGDNVAVYNALIKAKHLVDDDLMQQILEEINCEK